MKPNQPENKELRDLSTHETAITDRHETRNVAQPAMIEPGRSPGRVPDPNDAR
ncbi:hypothetical protein [Cohnella caldifontis]|uniref:hypothetical protein n=1 Tax=Cohnella caldifontis TaxID=3027471 RepID=UPI0023ED7561|nr:hypothetical protein [Cohnella sp. YIM B05605]